MSGAASLRAGDPWHDASQRRMDSIKTIRVEFSLEETYMPGSASRLMPGSTKVIPAVETKGVSENTLELDGKKLRYETNHPIWHIPDGILIQKPRLIVVNSEYSKSYYRDGIGRTPHASGLIGGRLEAMDVKGTQLFPLTVTLRGLDPQVCGDDLRRAVAGGRVRVQGHDCVEYTLTESPDHVSQYAVDPACDHLVRRVRTMKRGRVTDQILVELRQDSDLGWLPASWTRTETNTAGKVLTTTVAKVNRVSRNAAATTERFELMFPEGVRVHDQRTSKNYRVSADGSLREVDPLGNELGSVASQPGTPWHARNRGLVIGLLVSTLVLIVWLCVRKRRYSLATS